MNDPEKEMMMNELKEFFKERNKYSMSDELVEKVNEVIEEWESKYCIDELNRENDEDKIYDVENELKYNLINILFHLAYDITSGSSGYYYYIGDPMDTIVHNYYKRITVKGVNDSINKLIDGLLELGEQSQENIEKLKYELIMWENKFYSELYKDKKFEVGSNEDPYALLVDIIADIFYKNEFSLHYNGNQMDAETYLKLVIDPIEEVIKEIYPNMPE